MIELPELLKRCRAGDELAWESLVRRYEARVYGMALHYLRQSSDARDLTQEVFVRVWQNLAEHIEAGAFVPWLLTLTRNAAIDRLRRMKVRPADLSVPYDEHHDAPSAAPGPEAAAAAGEERALVHRALDTLSAANREILWMKEIQGLEVQTISDLLAVPVGTVKSRAHRARLELARAVLALDPSYGA